MRTSPYRLSRKFAKGTSTSVSLIRLAESLLWGLYGVCLTMHNLPQVPSPGRKIIDRLLEVIVKP